MQLSAQSIERLSLKSAPLIEPFRQSYKDPDSGLSGGLSCAGYDVSILNLSSATHKGRDLFHKTVEDYGASWRIPPHTGALGITVERFNLPTDIAMYYFNKSTLARLFIQAGATQGEPGWNGYLTLEIYNFTDEYVTLREGQPIGQVIFHQLDAHTAQPYDSKYQNAEAVPQEAK